MLVARPRLGNGWFLSILPRVVRSTPQQQFELSVETVEYVSCPAGEGVVDRHIDSQQHLLTITAHESSVPVLTIGEVCCSAQSATIRFLAVAALLRRGSTRPRSLSRSSACSTVPTEP